MAPTTFTYTAASLYEQVVTECGGSGLSSAQRDAVRNGIREALIDVWHDSPWTWRIKRTTITLCPGTPYQELPDDWDGFALTEIYRTDTDDAESHFMALASDADFERLYFSASSGEPQLFRVSNRLCGSTWAYVLEGAPKPDATYTYASVAYYSAAPYLTFSESTPPNMPTEFHDLWHEKAAANAARVLGLEDLAASHDAQYHIKMDRARKRRDVSFPKGPPRGLRDPYKDWQSLIW